jgi:hypothetical protein
LLDRHDLNLEHARPRKRERLESVAHVRFRLGFDDHAHAGHIAAMGLLVDNSVFRNGTERRPNTAFSNREYAGSGHGWSVGWAVAWNVSADYVLLQQPPGAKNWCIGCTGRPPTILWHGNPIPVPEIPSETFESPGVRVTPASLCMQQLRDRLGSAAIENMQ